MRAIPPGARVICVEANARIASSLLRSVEPLGYLVVVGAASDAAGMAELRIPRRYSGTSTIEGAGNDTRWSQPTRIQHVTCIPLAGLDQTLPPEPLLFKIDVEGHESAVLAGLDLASVSRQGRKWAGLVECLSPVNGVASVPFVYRIRASDGAFEDADRVDGTVVPGGAEFGKDIVLSSTPLA